MAQDSGLQIPLREKLKSIPEIFGIRLNEEPRYQVLRRDGPFEIRKYDRQLRAKITLGGMSFDEFRQQAFERLAKYIFGSNKRNRQIAMTSPVLQHKITGHDSDEIPMTAPVLQEQHAPGSAWTMSFILPHQYNFGNVPRPIDSDIRLREVESFCSAVVSFSGNNSIERIRKYEEELAAWVKKQKDFHRAGHFVIAQYDQPFVIPFLKRNEIQLKLTSIH